MVDDPTRQLPAFLDRHGLTPERLADVYERLSGDMIAEVAAVVDEATAGSVVPEVSFDDIRARRDLSDVVAAVRRRGCLVVRGTFDRELALEWDGSVDSYLAENRFDDLYRARYPDEERTRIWGVYWSPAQIAARQHEHMAETRAFLNSIWRHETLGQEWFEPHRDIGYPDRLRRRPPGVASRGLPPHSDAVSTGGWRLEENERVFRHVLAGDPAAYDPWDAAYRTTGRSESTAPASVFRTFQGWTALSEMRPEDGVLHVIPIPAAAAYMLVRGIASELGLLTGEPEAAPRRFRVDDLLLPALVPIPTVYPGDTVWWHGDIIHSVAAATNETRWGNVMYIAATPGCPRNDAYRTSMLERFERGLSPRDFPEEHFEVEFVGRPTVDDLGPIGRTHFGLGSVSTEPRTGG